MKYKRLLLSMLVAAAILLPLFADIKADSSLSVLRVPDDYATIQAAINWAMPGDKIIVAAGEWFGAEVWKPLEIVGEDGATIVDGPSSTADPSLKYGFWVGGGESGWADGTTIRGFEFRVGYPILGYNVTNITVKDNVLISPYWGITNMGGSGWTITHNDIIGLTDYPDRPWGSHGILLLSGHLSAPANNNTVAYNKISGEYSGYIPSAGILLQVDITWLDGSIDVGEAKFNEITENRVEMHGPQTAAVALYFSGEESSGIDPTDLICNNTICFNDLRGSTMELFFLPQTLKDCNIILYNLGKNRRHVPV